MRGGHTADDAFAVDVNLLWCVPGAVGGSEEYLIRQLGALIDGHSSRFQPTLHVPTGFAAAHPGLAARVPCRSAPTDGRRRAVRVTLESTWLARSTRSSELVHHGGGTMPPVRGGGAVVLTIHDLQFLSIPEYFSPLKLRYLRAMVPRSARAATVVAVPSAYVGSTVVERLGVDPDRVVVVPHGVGEELGARATPRDDLVRRFSLRPGRVIVYPAVTHPHKGHALLLDAVAELVHRRGLSDLQLVLTGGSGAAEADVQRAIERHGLGDNVVRTGRVNDDDRDGLIVMADALVFPSEYEGFGAPIIEAMRLGTPVVSSDQPAVVEVGGGAAIVAEREPDAWVDAILDAFDRPDELRSAGRERAAAFDVRASGDALAAAYDLALSIAGSRAGGER